MEQVAAASGKTNFYAEEVRISGVPYYLMPAADGTVAARARAADPSSVKVTCAVSSAEVCVDGQVQGVGADVTVSVPEGRSVVEVMGGTAFDVYRYPSCAVCTPRSVVGAPMVGGAVFHVDYDAPNAVTLYVDLSSAAYAVVELDAVVLSYVYHSPHTLDTREWGEGDHTLSVRLVRDDGTDVLPSAFRGRLLGATCS